MNMGNIDANLVEQGKQIVQSTAPRIGIPAQFTKINQSTKKNIKNMPMKNRRNTFSKRDEYVFRTWKINQG